MQWHFKIFGSVGEIGVFYGKFASVLATFTATEHGERFFVCDIFGNPKHMKLKTFEGRKDMFENAMNQVGFSIYHGDEEKKVRVFDDSSAYLSKSVYKTMILPAFRFYSIDGNHFLPYALHDIVHVTCVLREGGIIAIDDINVRGLKGVKQAVFYYMKMYSADVIVPLIENYKKLYMCTPAWYDTYMKYIEEKRLYVTLNLCKVSKEVLDFNFTWYQDCSQKKQGILM